MRAYFLLLLIMVMAWPASAQNARRISCERRLSADQIDLVKESKSLLGHVHPATMQAAVENIRQKDCPAVQVIMLAAAARTYHDLIMHYGLKDLEAQERLYYKIQMNMAFLQFTAGKVEGDDSHLNRLIRQKLMHYLPEGLMEHPGFYVPVDGL